ncbi:PREDICTED: sulfotransferase 1A1-like [Pygoscelis adeliae]|uniref:sulfotransferase 1A1-like n=1 Tax=Pygoscelis adeliae TaxID=9238 RepID=UPI0004F4F847|nr:PREDICTED: sulfotransferase 1A1-like [Pygoscelis adeliae]
MGKEDVVREELGSLHGIPLYKCFVEGWPQVEAFQARADDLLIATYPKSGTTWLSEILDMIYHDGDVEKCDGMAIFNRVPFLEMKVPEMLSGIELLEKTPSPRLVKTHLPVWLLPTSFQDQDSALQNPQQEVQKILQFLGKEVAEGTVARILHHTSFQEMRKNPAANYETMPTTLMDHSLSPFLRKGISGDWKNHFTVAQNECFDQHYQEHMAGSDLHFQMEA